MEESASNQAEKSESTSAISARPSSSKSFRSAILIVFLVMVIDLLGFGIVLPLLPRYGKEFLEPLFPGYGRLPYPYHYEPPVGSNGPYQGFEPYNGYESGLGLSF